MLSSLGHLRQPFHHYLSVNLGGKCAQAGTELNEIGATCMVKNTIPFDIRKFRKFKLEFFVEWSALFVTESSCISIECSRDTNSHVIDIPKASTPFGVDQNNRVQIEG